MTDGPGVVEIDDWAIDPESVGSFVRDDYYDVLARMRAESPVHPYAPNSWAVSRYAEVREVSRDPARFRSGGGVLMHDLARDGTVMPGSIIHMDPPVHAAWRKIGSRWFTPRAAARLEDQVRTETLTALDPLSVGDEVDLVATVAAPIPVMVIARLLGVADAERADLLRWSDASIEATDLDDPEASQESMAVVGELFGFLADETRRRRERPRDDLLSELATAQLDGRLLEVQEVVLYCMSLLVAGNETTRHLISGSAATLAGHPDQARALAGADDDTLAVAVEECVRWITPIQAFGRTATEDTTLGGRDIRAGDWVALLYASANRDEEVFGVDADRFDTTRPPNPTHLAFGFGEHLCMGAALARLEGRVFLDEYLRRFAATRVTGEPRLTRSTLVRGHAELPVTLAAV